MQKVKSIAFALVIGIAAIGLSTPTATATVILNVDASGQLTGARNVDVGGTLYDVTFMDGSCVSLFNGCNANDFAFNTLLLATTSAQALLDQVFADGTGFGNFNQRPDLTSGCLSPLACEAFIPYALNPISYDVSIVAANHFADPSQKDTIILIGNYDFNDDTTRNKFATYALFAPATLAPIPEPGPFFLFAVGLAFLAWLGRPRRQG